MTLPSLCVQGLISELRLRRDPQVSPRQCQDEDEDDDDDGVSSHCLAQAGGPLLLLPFALWEEGPRPGCGGPFLEAPK